MFMNDCISIREPLTSKIDKEPSIQSIDKAWPEWMDRKEAFFGYYEGL